MADFFPPHYFELANDHRLHYVDEGAGPTVLMVHGNPSWSFMWRHLISALSPGFRCLAPDHLGMGLSSRPGAHEYSFRLADRVADLEAFMEAAAPEGPVHIAAHDWGGPIALGWAVRNPHRVASVTLMNTGLRLPFGYKLPWRLAIFKRLAPLGSLLAVRGNLFAWGTACFGAQALKSEARREILAPYREASQRLAIGKFVEDIPLSPEHPSYQTLADIDMRAEKLLAEKPFQLVWGLRDFVFNRRVFLDWRERFPEAPFLALPEAGHYLMEDEPERVAEAVKDFISRARRP